MEFLEIVIMTGVLIFAMMVIQNKKPREQKEKQQIFILPLEKTIKW